MPTDTAPNPADVPARPLDRVSESTRDSSTALSLLANSPENNKLSSTKSGKEPDVLDMNAPIGGSSNMSTDSNQESALNQRHRERQSQEQSTNGGQPEKAGDAEKKGDGSPVKTGDGQPEKTSYAPTPDSNEPQVRTQLDESGRPYTERTWPNGSSEREFADGTRLTMKPTDNGGHLAQFYDANGNLLSRTLTHPPAADGSIRSEHTNLANPNLSHNATHYRDGSVRVEFADGRTMTQRPGTNPRGDRTNTTTSTGPNPRDNFTAVDTHGPNGTSTLVNFGDGTSFTRHPDGSVERRGGYPGSPSIARFLGNSNAHAQDTMNSIWHLNVVAQYVGPHDVRRGHG